MVQCPASFQPIMLLVVTAKACSKGLFTLWGLKRGNNSMERFFINISGVHNCLLINYIREVLMSLVKGLKLENKRDCLFSLGIFSFSVYLLYFSYLSVGLLSPTTLLPPPSAFTL